MPEIYQELIEFYGGIFSYLLSAKIYAYLFDFDKKDTPLTIW